MSFNITPVASGYQEIHPYSAMNIDSVKINTSLIMMKEWPVHARGVRARTHARVGGWVEVGIAQTRRENHILFYSSLSNGASKLSYQLKLILHCKVQYFGNAHNCCVTQCLQARLLILQMFSAEMKK